MAALEDFDPEAIVARADALMQRQRPTAAEFTADADDLPVLTEIVDAHAAHAAEPADAIDPAVLNILAGELARRVEDRLTVEIPELVEAAMHKVRADLIADLEQRLGDVARTAIRDFLSERERLARLQQH